MTQIAPYRQLGLVVRDIEAAIAYWTEVMGVGPFVLLRNRVFEDYRYRGSPAEAPVVSIAIAFSGDFQIELIEQHNDAQSAYLEFLAEGREGPQHMCMWFDTREGYDEARARLVERGLTVVHEGRSKGVDTRFAYFEGPAGGWPMVEICDALLPIPAAMFRQLIQEGRDWTGTPAYRELQVTGGGTLASGS